MTEPRDPSWSCPGSDASFGWGFGDPHVKTLDGYTYDFQAIGNFTYVQSTRKDFELHVQQQPYKTLRHASVNSAVAVRDGADRIEWAIDRLDPLLNGVTRPMTAGTEVRLRSRGVLRHTPDGFLFVSSVGDRLQIIVSPEMVDFFLRPAAHRRGQLRGLLGNFDGDPDNDLQTPDGRVVTLGMDQRVDATHPLYAVFGASWRSATGSSLIARALSTAIDAPSFPAREPEVNDDEMIAARARCAANGITEAAVQEDCAFDIVATGQDTFAVSAARAGKEADRLARASGREITTNATVTGALDGRDARSVFSVALAAGNYVFDGRGSERTTWMLSAPDGTRLFDAEQSRFMAENPVSVTIATAGIYTVVVGVRFEMLDGTFRFRVIPAASK